MTQSALADDCQVERTYVSRVESGTRFPSERYVEACDRIFGTSGVYTRLRRRLLDMGHPGWFRKYVALEREVVEIHGYANSFMMGLLQTPEYAYAVFRAAHPRETDARIKTRVAARMRRHEVLERTDPPLLWFIIHEGALRTVVGSSEVMVGQLERLAQMAESPNVVVQVLPFSAGAPAAGSPFMLLTQGNQEGRILYSDTIGHGYMNDSPAVVSSWGSTFDRLRMAAESETRSLGLIHSIMKEHAR
ncbi:Helix-turn-helix domain-containing protein [Streptomyces clavuligerus]|uniref:Helix-turn-helix domain-containing protein n=2 Tax=Streptomyces clavuligerus TaxID=1901 RepID=E2Q6E0_STRCL|nr:Helix-turn-helix domain-containing protein [Streptomyces clavuligerus]